MNSFSPFSFFFPSQFCIVSLLVFGVNWLSFGYCQFFMCVIEVLIFGKCLLISGFQTCDVLSSTVCFIMVKDFTVLGDFGRKRREVGDLEV